MVKSVDFLLPQVSAGQLQEQGVFCEHLEAIDFLPLNADWETVFCEKVGYESDSLPWSFLRKEQFQLSDNIQTICCCDPIINQLTHQGAYMLGQAPLALSPNDAIRIVTKINETLMGDDEQIYMVDQFSWIYCSEKKLSFKSQNIGDLIGKDMFNFSYQGKDAEHFKRLNMEIQMLIKQMVDYNELPEPAPETLINLHFYDLIDLQNFKELEFIKNEKVSIISNNDLIKSFCLNTFVKQNDIEDIDESHSSHQVVVALDSEKEHYESVIGYWLHLNLNHKKVLPSIYCQDSIIKFKDKGSWFSKLFAK